MVWAKVMMMTSRCFDTDCFYFSFFVSGFEVRDFLQVLGRTLFFFFFLVFFFLFFFSRAGPKNGIRRDYLFCIRVKVGVNWSYPGHGKLA